MRASPPLDIVQYVKARLEELRPGDADGYCVAALAAVVQRTTSAHGDCDGCRVCRELATGQAVIDAYEAHIGPPPAGTPMPRQRVKGPRHTI